ncbi:MAG: MBL fold metallo-hydrolase [Patescibacteria group bacterium]
MSILKSNYYKKTAIPYLSFLVWSSIKGHLTPLKPANKRWIVLDPKKLQLWMIGHATLFINFFGTFIVTDPVFGKNLTFHKRLVAPGFKITDLPEIDYVILSHAHPDHCHKKSLRNLSRRAKTIILPKNCSDLVRGMHYKKQIELSWQKFGQFPDLTIQAYKPVHWGQRYFWDRTRRGYNSYVLKKNGFSIFFCGDSAYGKFFKDIGRKNKIDLALLPIGTYNTPNLRRNHMGPADAMQAFSDLRAEHLVPIHWGNFRMSREPAREPAEHLEKLGHQANLIRKIHILNNGENYSL